MFDEISEKEVMKNKNLIPKERYKDIEDQKLSAVRLWVLGGDLSYLIALIAVIIKGDI